MLNNYIVSCARVCLLCVALFSVSGCALGIRPMVGAPWMQDYMMNGPPGSPKLFQKGWRDGCETGIAVTSNSLQRMFYSFKQDYELVQQREYYAGWQAGLKFCHRYLFQYYKREYF